MRTFFEPEEQEEFRAAQDLMVRRFGLWADGARRPVDLMVAEAAWEYRHGATPDGRLTLWSAHHVREFLLDWLPRWLTVRPGDEMPDGPGTLGALLEFFDEMGLRDPRGGARDAVGEALEEAGRQYPEAMADRERWGMAKFWATTAAEQGVDITDTGAMQRFAERAQRGQVPYDEALVERLMHRHLSRTMAGGRALPQLPVTLPSVEELRHLAQKVPVVRRLRVFAQWVGPAGRKLTQAGRLQMNDARELVALLDTGDVIDPVYDGVIRRTRSSADLTEVNRIFEWAKKARLVRPVKGRVMPVAKAAPLLTDPLLLFQRAFEAVSGLGETLLGARGTWALPPSLLYDVYEDTLADILNTLYSLPARMPWPLLRDSVHLTYRTAYDIDRADAHIRSAWLQRADADLRTVLEVLEQLGTVERSVGMASQLFLDDLDNLDAEPGRSSGGTNPVGPGAVLAPADSPNPHAPDVIPGGPADLMRIPDQDDTSRAVTGPVLSRDQAPTLREELTSGPTELIGLTPLATWAVRERLLSEGRDAPLIGELTHATPSELLGVLAEHYPAEAIEQEVERWSAVHGGRPEAFNTLLDAVRRTPFRIRAHDMLRVLCAVLPEDEAHGLLLSLRSDPALAPTALSALVHQEVVHEEDLTDAEHLLLLTESLLSAMEGAGHQAAIDFLQTLGQQEAQAALSAALDSAHPDHTGLEELRTLAGELKAPARPHPRRGAPPTGRSKNHAPTGRKRRRI